MPRLPGNQITFGGTRFDFVLLCIIEVGYPPTVVKPNLVPPKGILFPANLGLVLTQLTTWDDW